MREKRSHVPYDVADIKANHLAALGFKVMGHTVFGYKAFTHREKHGGYRCLPKHWQIRRDRVLTMCDDEIFDPNPTVMCGHGIHVATMEWLVCAFRETDADEWEDATVWEVAVNLDNTRVVLPHESNGKFRATHVQLIRRVYAVDFYEDSNGDPYPKLREV